MAAPEAMLVIAAFAGIAAPVFFLTAGERRLATGVAGGLVVSFAALLVTLHGSPVLSPLVIRNERMKNVVVDRWNDFSRVLVKRGPFFTWGLSETYRTEHPPQYDLLIEGVAGTQIQHCPDGDVSKLDFLRYDVSSLPHLLRPTGSALALGVGAGLDVMMAKHHGKDPVVGVEVNPLVGDIVNEQFGSYSGRPYYLPGVTVHFENARTFVKRDRNRYDVVTVTWVDSGAATGAGAFALTENYLYTVEAFRDYLDRLKDDGVLAFMRARHSPEYDAIKGIGIAVEALREMGIADPGRYITVTSVASPHFDRRELTQVLVKRTPFSPAELAIIDEAQSRLHFNALYTPGRTDGDTDIERLITGTDRAAVYASFAFDMEPNTDDRPFYFFLREGFGQPGGREVRILRQSIVAIFVLIGLFALLPLGVLLRRNIGGLRAIATSTAYFSLLGVGFMLIEMKLLQQSVLIIGNPTLSLAAVLAALLLSTGAGALLSQRHKLEGGKAAVAFLVLLASLVVSLATSSRLADWLTGFSAGHCARRRSLGASDAPRYLAHCNEARSRCLVLGHQWHVRGGRQRRGDLRGHSFRAFQGFPPWSRLLYRSRARVLGIARYAHTARRRPRRRPGARASSWAGMRCPQSQRASLVQTLARFLSAAARPFSHVPPVKSK
jgi:hypothetical protein